MRTATIFLILAVEFCSAPAYSECVMTRDFISGDSEANMSKIYSYAREKDYKAIGQMVLNGRAKILKKGMKVYRTDGGFFSSTVTVGASPKKWIVSNDRFKCTGPGSPSKPTADISKKRVASSGGIPKESSLSLQDQLSEACRKEDLNTYVRLIRVGANPMQPDSRGRKPLSYIRNTKLSEAYAYIGGLLVAAESDRQSPSPGDKPAVSPDLAPLGISYAHITKDLIDIFPNIHEAPLSDGTPRLLGHTVPPLCSMEIYGSKAKPGTVTMFMMVHKDLPPSAFTTALVLFARLVQNTVPQWQDTEEVAKWMGDNANSLVTHATKVATPMGTFLTGTSKPSKIVAHKTVDLRLTDNVLILKVRSLP